MKKILFCIVTVFAVNIGCNWFEEHFGETFFCIDIINNSTMDIYTYAAYITGEAVLPVDKPKLEIVNPKKSTAYYDREFNDDEFSRMENGESIAVFIFNKKVVDKNEWPYIRENNKILRTYIVTWDSSWRIYYPSK